jgi:Phytanoyl-CoA dioxygenase (PhyH)
LRIDRAFTPETAEAARRILWRDTGCDPDDPGTWTEPVIRLGDYRDPPFVEAANTAVLRAAYDQLVGKNRWRPRTSLGTFPVRFPSPVDPGDTGWHIDASFQGDASSLEDYLSWRVNILSWGRALLMLFLFSDVEEDDAPTRIRVGSHVDMTRVLAPRGEGGLSLRELAVNNFAESAHRPQISATGAAGTVYLCHPFLVHAAQPHRGGKPRFLAQPPLYPVGPLRLLRDDGDYSPVEQAIRAALPFSY